jgi:hypothetical protein
MTGPQTAAPPSVQRTASRTAGLSQASLTVLIVQFALGIGVNLYVTLPAAAMVHSSAMARSWPSMLRLACS